MKNQRARRPYRSWMNSGSVFPFNYNGGVEREHLAQPSIDQRFMSGGPTIMPHLKQAAFLLCGILSFVITAELAPAATFSLSTIDPTVDGADIALLPGGSTLSFPNDDSSAIWSNRPDQGQTFTTGSNASGYTMNGFSMLHNYGGGWDIGTLRLAVGTLDGSNIFTPLVSETIAAVDTPTVAAGSTWFNFELGSPLHLDANSQYAFITGNPDGNGAVFVQSTPDSYYAGGNAIRDAGANAVFDIGSPLIHQGFDRVFHVDLEANAVPEPSSLILGLLGLAVLGAAALRRPQAK